MKYAHSKWPRKEDTGSTQSKKVEEMRAWFIKKSFSISTPQTIKENRKSHAKDKCLLLTIDKEHKEQLWKIWDSV